MDKQIEILLVQPNQEPKQMTITDKLESYQKLVGGYIECVDITPDIVLICNEEGKLNGLPMNRLLLDFQIYDAIMGDFILVGAGEDGDFISLTPEQKEKLKTTFALSL